MEQKILTSGSPSDLNLQIQVHLNNGWVPVGSHQVVITHTQNRFSGSTLRDTMYSHEYSQSVKRLKKNIKVVKL